LARPYPQLISGTPTSWSFDPTTRVFAFRYTQAHAAGRGAFPAGSQTVIAVPSLAYPHGYHVRVTGGSVVSASASLVVASGPQAGPITVTVTPA
jgi:endoglycosylceramidase